MKVLHTVHISGDNESRQTILSCEHDDLFKLYCDFNQVDEDDAEREAIRAGRSIHIAPLGIFNLDPHYLESYVVLESDDTAVHVVAA